jgi:uncharacterized protein YggT (Ycf19 family)
MTPSVLLVSIIPYPLNSIIYSVINFYMIVIIVWALLSWVNKGSGFINDLYQMLDKLVEPYVGLFRRFIPAAGGMDFSALVAILVLQIVARILL